MFFGLIKEGAQLVEHKDINPEVSGSSPAAVNFSLFNPKLFLN